MFRKPSCIQICKKVHTQNFRHVTDFLRPPHFDDDEAEEPTFGVENEEGTRSRGQ